MSHAHFRILPLLSIGLFSFALAGCGSSQDEDAVHAQVSEDLAALEARADLHAERQSQPRDGDALATEEEAYHHDMLGLMAELDGHMNDMSHCMDGTHDGDMQAMMDAAHGADAELDRHHEQIVPVQDPDAWRGEESEHYRTIDDMFSSMGRANGHMMGSGMHGCMM